MTPNAKVPGSVALPKTRSIDLAIVVPSCDAYADIWPSFFTNLFHSWPDCPFPVYLVSNHLQFSDPRVEPHKVGEDRGWSANLKSALAAVPQQYVMLIVDDLYPMARIDTRDIVSLFEEVGELDYLRLNPYPGPRNRISDRVGLVPAGDIYRTSTVFSIWRREVLRDLLLQEELPWEFELNGSERSDRFHRWYASCRWLIPYVNLVVKRKIDPLALRKLRKVGIEVSSPRDRLSVTGSVLLQLKKVRSWTLARLPWQIQRRIRGRF